MSRIAYRTGDATRPEGPGPKLLVHVCNDAGKWGKGFVLAVSRRWPEPEARYREAFASAAPPGLGDVQVVPVEKDLSVVNLVGQHGVRRAGGRPPIRYDALARGLEAVGRLAAQLGASVHLPRIGCGLAGGRWEEVEPLLVRHLGSRGLAVTVYDLPV